VEICGSGLEFLDRHYPQIIELIRELLHWGKIELISSTFAPTAWIAFPERDLVKSVEINLKLLDRLRLPRSRIFFSQECFFGVGLVSLNQYFDAFLCKDDYLKYFLIDQHLDPIYDFGKGAAIVGANHIFNEIIRESHAGGKIAAAISQALVKKVASLPKLLRLSDPRPNEIGNHQFFWYHMGSAHHFSTLGSPTDMDSFYINTDWINVIADYLEGIMDKGFQFGFMSDILAATAKCPRRSLPFIPEGSWNSERSLGVYAWMGKSTSKWHNSSATLAKVWKSREALRLSESTATHDGGGPITNKELERLWANQIEAESSDSLGWIPTFKEVCWGRDIAEKIRRAVAGRGNVDFTEIVLEATTLDRVPCDPEAVPVATDSFGGDSTINWSVCKFGCLVCDVEIRADGGGPAGIRFQKSPHHILYCPTGRESFLYELDVSQFRPENIYLPLSNGLISIGLNIFLIRINTYGVIAAKVSRNGRAVEFSIDDAYKGLKINCAFLIYHGNAVDAIQLANRINMV
jgi:hypothetical protein